MANHANNVRMIARSTPADTPSNAGTREQLFGALASLLNEDGRGSRINNIDIQENTPAKGMQGYIDSFSDLNKYASSGKQNPRSDTPKGTDDYYVKINPNADRSYFAHELGHIAAQQYDVGALAHNLSANPAMKRALGASLLLVPGTAAALEAGDDDMDTSIALGLAAASPTILAEGLATKHGLNIMDTAGMRATLGQRGRLAGGLLSYVGAPIAVAAGANIVGNQFDDPAAQQGELPM